MEENKIRGDFMVLGKYTDQKGIIRFKLKCTICGLEKIVSSTTFYDKNRDCTSHERCCARQRNREKFANSNDFGDYELLEIIPNNNPNNKHKLGRFRCKVCGREKVITITGMKQQSTNSHKYCIKQVECDKRFRSIFNSMKTRCTNEKSDRYPNYGGRGIKCEYENLIDFYDDFYEEYMQHVRDYGEKQTTVERKDVNGNYCKENITFATLEEQARNKTNNSHIIITDLYTNRVYRFNTIVEAADAFNIGYNSLTFALTNNSIAYNRFKIERGDQDSRIFSPAIFEK